MSDTPTQPPGWYYAQGDPPGTQRYWDGTAWQGGPQPVPGGVADPTSAAASATASAGQRIGARIIDGIIWLVIQSVCNLVIGGGMAGFSSDPTAMTARQVIGGLVGVLAVAAYETFLVGNRGATFGKQALNIKVVNDDGSAPDVSTGARRIGLWTVLSVLALVPSLIFSSIISGIFFIVALAGLIMLFANDNAQTPWDKIGRTLVVTD